MLAYFTLPLLLLSANSPDNPASQFPGKIKEVRTGTQERMIVGSGTVTMNIDFERLKGVRSGDQEMKRDTLHFEVHPNSFFTIRIMNGGLRGPESGSMKLSWTNSSVLPEPLGNSSAQLLLEKTQSKEGFDLVIRDGKAGLVLFNVRGPDYEYDAVTRSFRMNGGTLLISAEFANKLGRPADAGVVVGNISITAAMVPIETTKVVNGVA